ncbi:MAG: DUF3592 domain-containing protein [Clostridia bacterium]|nr:DUF3592 domain-containing protein [Clostridia bacterium]
MKLKSFISVFFGIFILVGMFMTVYGLVTLAKYNYAEEVNATVTSVNYPESGGLDVDFEYLQNGEYVQTSVHYNKVSYKNGIPYGEGKVVQIRVDDSGKVLQYGTGDILLTVAGFIFMAVGASFIYLFVFRKRSLADIAYDYERAIVSPQEAEGKTAKYEAHADELTRLPQTSVERKIGEAGVWRRRIGDRFKTFSVWENMLFGSLLILPIIILSVLPLFFGKKVSVGSVVGNALAWLFVYCFVGLFFKSLYFLYLRILAKRGRFSEKRLATVKCSAFESSSSFQTGGSSRTYTVSKKFRVVAQIDGKHSVGYVRGNVPPAEGTVIKVLIRPNRPRRWIIDRE